MTTMPPETPPEPRSALRELAGLALLFVGSATVSTIAFLVDPKLGIALLGTAALVAGARLTFREA